MLLREHLREVPCLWWGVLGTAAAPQVKFFRCAFYCQLRHGCPVVVVRLWLQPSTPRPARPQKIAIPLDSTTYRWYCVCDGGTGRGPYQEETRTMSRHPIALPELRPRAAVAQIVRNEMRATGWIYQMLIDTAGIGVAERWIEALAWERGPHRWGTKVGW